MRPYSVKDGADTFQLTVLEANEPSQLVLFCVGGGGDPGRHLPLLQDLVDHGCTVIAPHFERLTSPHVTLQDLVLRARRLRLAVAEAGRPELSLSGVGHSIGATMLIALAGGKAWLSAGECLDIAPLSQLSRVALFAPATLFFQAPNALDTVHAPIRAWVGTKDEITPPEQALFLQRALAERVPVEVRVVPDAGHFSFMHVPPPGTTEPLPNRQEFLSGLTVELWDFIGQAPGSHPTS